MSVGSDVFTGGRSYQSLELTDLLCRVRLSSVFVFIFFKHSFSLCYLDCSELTVVFLPQIPKCRDHSLSHRTQQYLVMLMVVSPLLSEDRQRMLLAVSEECHD